LCPDLYDFNSSHYQTFKYFLPSDNEPILKELAKYTKSDQAHKFITYILIDNIMQGERFREVKGHEIDFGASWLPIYQHTANEIAKKGEAAYQPLIDYLSSKEESLVVKRIAVLSLGMLKNEKAIEPLANLLKTPQDNTHSLDLFIAHALLFEIGGERCIDIIVNYIKENHDRAYLWQESQRVLSDQLVDKVGYRKSDIWLSQLKDNVILGHIADNSLDLIIKRLDSLGWKPQNDEFSVYFWIGKQNKDEVIKMGEIAVLPLINILEGNFKDSLVAAHSLVEIGDKRAVKPLINFYRENIKRYKGSTFINIFDKLLEWPGLEEPSQNEIKLILDEIKAYLELEESITSFSDMFGIDRTDVSIYPKTFLPRFAAMSIT